MMTTSERIVCEMAGRLAGERSRGGGILAVQRFSVHLSYFAISSNSILWEKPARAMSKGMGRKTPIKRRLTTHFSQEAG
jgi:hypothetical protein